MEQVAVSILRYFRNIGIASIVLGAAGLIQGHPEYFWLFVVLVYAGMIAVGIDICFVEEWPRRWIRWAGGTLIFFVIGVFSLFFVFVDAPVAIVWHAVPAQYPQGTVIAGIPWRPEFTELMVRIKGSNTMNYSDMDIVITSPDFPIAAIGQISTIPNIYFENAGNVYPTIQVGDLALPVVLLATDAGYRVRGNLPAGDTLELALAVVDIKWGAHTGVAPTDHDYMFRMKTKDGKTYWYGYADGDVYSGRPSPQHVSVVGCFVAAQRERCISQLSAH